MISRLRAAWLAHYLTSGNRSAVRALLDMHHSFDSKQKEARDA